MLEKKTFARKHVTLASFLWMSTCAIQVSCTKFVSLSRGYYGRLPLLLPIFGFSLQKNQK